MKLRHQGFDELLLLDTQIMPLKIDACTFVLFPTTFLTTAVFWRGLWAITSWGQGAIKRIVLLSSFT